MEPVTWESLAEEQREEVLVLRAKLQQAEKRARATARRLRFLRRSFEKVWAVVAEDAASQAEAKALREAARRVVKAWNDLSIPGDDGDAALIELNALVKAPGSTDALMAVARRAVELGQIDATCAMEEGKPNRPAEELAREVVEGSKSGLSRGRWRDE